jgi:hypothetical protein
MEVIVDRVVGLDVHKETMMVAVRRPSERGRRVQEVREFGTFHGDLLALRDWLVASQRATRPLLIGEWRDQARTDLLHPGRANSKACSELRDRLVQRNRHLAVNVLPPRTIRRHLKHVDDARTRPRNQVPQRRTRPARLDGRADQHRTNERGLTARLVPAHLTPAFQPKPRRRGLRPNPLARHTPVLNKD